LSEELVFAHDCLVDELAQQTHELQVRHAIKFTAWLDARLYTEVTLKHKIILHGLSS